MEFTSHTVKHAREKSRAFSQITLDDDYVVKDNRPDVVKIIHTAGTIAFEETRLANQTLWVTGKLQFTVLYRSDNENSRLETLSGTIPFQEKLVMEGADDMDPVRLLGEMEDLSVGLINSRKLSVRAVANLKADVEELCEETIVSGIEEGAQILQKTEEFNLLSMLAAGKDIVRFHGEAALSNAKPNIEKLLWQDVELRNAESSFANGRIQIRGDIYFSAVYLGGDRAQLQWLEKILPFSEELEVPSADTEQSAVLWLTIRPESVDVELRNDYDGESRIFGIEAAFAVDYKVWAEENVPVLMDAYAPDRTLTLHRAPCEVLCFLMKNEAKIRLHDTVTLDSNQENILQIGSGTGQITVDRTTVEENGIRFEGVVTIRILYLTSDDNLPIACTECTLPFDQVVEITGIQQDTRFVYKTSVEQLQVSLLDSSEYEVKASIGITVLAFSGNCFEKIESIDEALLPMEEFAGWPGLIGYVVADGETLWDIAKRFHTTTEDILSVNGLKSENVRAGTKLLLVKQVRV